MPHFLRVSNSYNSLHTAIHCFNFHEKASKTMYKVLSPNYYFTYIKVNIDINIIIGYKSVKVESNIK